jgi:DNA-directed RNA polymerase I, II, and III subunit RPABC2
MADEDDFIEDDGNVFEEDVEEETLEASENKSDLNKLFQQHPEIWIPLEEQVKQSLLPTGPSDEKHKTRPFLTNYEKTKIISLRARMIEEGAHPYIKVPEGMTESYKIAMEELKEKKIPFIIKRPLPDGKYEYWRLCDLMIL